MATFTTEETVNVNEDKSLLSKAKDTLFGLKDQALGLFRNKYSDPNKVEIKGMSKADFEATKVILESKLHLKGMKGYSFYPKYYESSWSSWNNSLQFDSSLSSNKLEKREEEFFDQSKGEYEKVKQQEWMQPPNEIFKDVEFKDDRKDEMKFISKDTDEVHVLPTIKVKEQPKIIEREIQYEKPVEIKQTIVHQEKPIIVEQPIVKEVREHYREDTQHVKNEKKVITETSSNDNNLDKEALLNLKQEKLDTYNNEQPIIEQQKERVQLDTEYREQPTIVNSKQTVYQQPVEIEQRFIEKVKPIVNEQVTINKEHVHEKLAPEHYVKNVQQVDHGDHFFSKDLSNGGVDATNAIDERQQANIAGEQ